MERERKFYIDGLKSEKCQCRKSKRPRKSLCFGCWSKLPNKMKGPLYRRFGNGYEEALDDALKFLEGGS